MMDLEGLEEPQEGGKLNLSPSPTINTLTHTHTMSSWPLHPRQRKPTGLRATL